MQIRGPSPFGATNADDTINGDALANTICGLSGNDGNDKLYGNDVLYGARGRDTLNGGKGKDRFFGGRGNDKLTGGAGVNRYSGGSGNDSINARNRSRETVSCGGGKRDRATVDRRDRVKGCESVKRAKKRR